MTATNYTRTLLIERATPVQVFDAVTNPRAWWSEDVLGDPDRLGSVFYYHFKDIHRGTFLVSQLDPGKRVVWHVLQNRFNFTRDPAEWTGTDIVFELAPAEGGTELRFTHIGLHPDEECYAVCNDSWNFYLASLHQLITTGSGQPNKGEANANPVVVPPPTGQLTETVTVNATPEAAFAAINNVRDWWSGSFEGDSHRLGDSFAYRYKHMHYSKQAVTELVPGRRIAWQVLESNLSFLADPSEWAGTTIMFDILPKGDKTEVTLTHVGLTALSECYDSCYSAWSSLVKTSLKELIEKGRTELLELDSAVA